MAGPASVTPTDFLPAEDNTNPNTFTFPDFFNLAAGESIPDANLKQNPQQEGAALIAAGLLSRLEEVAAINSDDEDEGPMPEEAHSSDEELEHDDAESTYESGRHQKCPRTMDKEEASAEWYPWKDRITCTLDILMHLPRSVFSQKQLDLFLWLLRINGVSQVPTVKTMKSLNNALQKMCGIDTLCYDGALGNRYYVNSLAQIIAQELANPHVCPKLQFYPEDSGAHLSEARQAQQWLNEAPDTLLTPMARINSRDFYIHEPAMLLNGSCCIPMREAAQGGESSKLKADAEPLYGLPDPSKLLALTIKAVNSGHIQMQRKVTVGKNFPVVIALSRFQSGSAGLPRSESAKEYNIHFLCTSNTAPPLEMLDGVIDQLEVAQEEGIWAWDYETKEPVLVIPWVLALLGDNPMQSEFAGHIGLRGKYFCRVCWVKGVDAKDQESPEFPDDDYDRGSARSDGEHSSGPGSDSEQSQPDTSRSASPAVTSSNLSPNKSKSKKKFTEGFSQMFERITSFIKPGKARNKDQTITQLRSYFADAKTLGSKTKVKGDHTSSSVKDTFQEYFLDRLFSSYAKKRTVDTRQAALEHEIRMLPEETTSPVWRIKGLDPHQDTPVEILHVVLLGFLKYMWRDLVNQVKNQEELKSLLETRLKSLNIDGLEISPVAGHTLVQYAGSLTGRDFRVIAQIAPFIIHDIKISDSCREAWLALSRLVPLIWQPEIDDIDAYTKLLEHEIEYFLLRVAQWTSRWFNKPKFHILVHLALHIRRFGPAMLFATEAFESFNAVIRAKSVHLNRQAPSRDIALWTLLLASRFSHSPLSW
ncbi:hypothetical protein FB446DRAFT_795079 [Lentinula raphanica]|nr:hypothetical protein FB446DRAFT_795079 [Lentinula raphanica]